jgi:hypothetical protein
VVGAELELERRVARSFKLTARGSDTHAESLHEPKHPKSLRQVWIPIVDSAGLTEVLGSHNAKWTAWVRNLNPVVEPVNVHGCVGGFVGAVQDSIANELLERH